VKRWSSTQRILVGALALAVAGWGLDALTRSSGPRPARGADSGEGVQPATAAGVEDSAQLVQRLLSRDYASVAAELDRTERDLFVPTPLMQVATAPQPVPGEEPEPPSDLNAEPDFPSKHVLTGVIIGHTPLAQVDGRLLPLGAVLDGHTLVEIQRDGVVFADSESPARVTLELKRPATNPSRNP
jgi:hypothetical protein